jgi:hypothetical protein
MLRKFLDVFFPGFGWEHGFALWDVGSALSIGGSIAGGLFGDDAAEDAADAQSASAAAAIEELRKIGARTRSDTAPYRALGSGAVNKLAYLMGVGGSPDGSSGGNDAYTLTDFFNYGKYWRNATGSKATDGELMEGARQQYEEYLNGAFGDGAATDAHFGGKLRDLEAPKDYSGDEAYGSILKTFGEEDLENDVVYNKALQFGLDEGTKALERRSLANGGLDSGATAKALTRFANDYGETKAAGAHQRFMGDKAFTINALMGTTGVGQWGVGLDANTGAQMAQAIGNAQMGAGNAQAAGIVGGANAWGNAFGGIGNAVGQYQNNQILDRVLRGGGADGYVAQNKSTVPNWWMS